MTMWWSLAFAGVADCETLWKNDPTDPTVWRCAYQAGAGGELDASIAFTEAALATGPVTPQIHLTHGNLLSMAGKERAADAFGLALQGFRASSDVPGQVKTHLNLANYHRHAGDAVTGRSHLDAGAAVAGASEPFHSMIAIEQSRWTCDIGGDYALALRTLQDLQPQLDNARFPTHGKVLIHHTRRCLADRLGRTTEARGHAEALLRLARSTGNAMLAIATLDNLLWMEADSGSVEASFDERVRQALEEATALGHPPTIADLTCLAADRDPKLLFTDCLDAVEGRNDPIAARAWTLATKRAIDRGNESLALQRSARATAIAAESHSLESKLSAAIVAAQVADAFSPTTAIAAGSVAVEAVRDLRERQVDALVRGRFVSQWSSVFFDQAQRLRDRGQTADAIEIIERLRGYRTLERLDRTGATDLLRPSAEAWQERDRLLKAIDDLLQSGEEPERLSALERKEAAVRETLLSTVPAFAQLRAKAVDLMAIRGKLQPNEAVLMPVMARSPWMAVVRRDRVEAIDLPDLSSWSDRIEPLSTLARDGDPLAAPLLREFSRALLQPTASLLEDVEHLIIVTGPDLHGLPWPDLQRKNRTLDESFNLSFAPSLRTWAALRDRPSHPDGATVVLSAPTLPPALQTLAPERLPEARSEGLTVASLAPARTLEVTGDEASEAILRNALDGPIRLVHLAAHAIVDSDDPERSAILLAEGGEQDGRLQAREVVGLDLDGSVIVLAACGGADGEVGAEGVSGLAEAFLQAGARAVVASLDPVPDRVGRDGFELIHQHLASGERLDRGVAAARSSHPSLRGLRVIGDGSVRLPGARSPWVGLTAAFLALGLALGGWWLVRGTRS